MAPQAATDLGQRMDILLFGIPVDQAMEVGVGCSYWGGFLPVRAAQVTVTLNAGLCVYVNEGLSAVTAWAAQRPME